MVLKFNNALSKVFVILIPILYFGAHYFNFYSEKFLFWYSFEGFLYHLSWYALLFVMIIRPLGDLQKLFGKDKIFYNLKKLLPLRKAFGILSAMIIVTILVGKYIYNPDLLSNFFNAGRWNIYYPIIARISEITAIILLLSSNLFSQKLLKKSWKKIQRSSYIYFISGGIIAGQYENMYYYTMGFVLLIYVITFITEYKKS